MHEVKRHELKEEIVKLKQEMEKQFRELKKMQYPYERVCQSGVVGRGGFVEV